MTAAAKGYINISACRMDIQTGHAFVQEYWNMIHETGNIENREIITQHRSTSQDGLTEISLTFAVNQKEDSAHEIRDAMQKSDTSYKERNSHIQLLGSVWHSLSTSTCA